MSWEGNGCAPVGHCHSEMFWPQIPQNVLATFFQPNEKVICQKKQKSLLVVAETEYSFSQKCLGCWCAIDIFLSQLHKTYQGHIAQQYVGSFQNGSSGVGPQSFCHETSTTWTKILSVSFFCQWQLLLWPWIFRDQVYKFQETKNLTL